MLDILAVVTIQSTFRFKIYQNNIFYLILFFLKIIFNIIASKQFKTLKNK